MLIENLIATLPDEPHPVRAIVSGLHWTAVASRYCGLASSLWSESLPEVEIPAARDWLGQSAQDLARLALSNNHLEAAVGMAAINSLMVPNPPGALDLNAHEWLLANGSGKKIAMVGHFPFAEEIRSIAKTFWVLEKNPRPGDLPASESRNLIPEADIVAITGSAFVNHSIDEVVGYCRSSSTVLILGPSTPLSHLLFNYGISILSGTYVVNEEMVLKSIQEGATNRNLTGVRRMTITKPEENLA